MLTPDQLTTIRAALRFWRDEIVPAGNAVSSHYYDTDVKDDLTTDDIERLIECLQPTQIRCVLITPSDFVLAVTRDPATAIGTNRIGTLVFGPAAQRS